MLKKECLVSIKLAIFDFDGTIADTRKAIVAAKQKTMLQMGLEVADERTCASTIGFSAKTGFEMIYPQLEEQKIDECVTIYRQEFEQIRKLMPPEIFPDVKDVLERLNQTQVVTTIASSRNTPSLKGFLDDMGIAEYFPYILGGNDTGKLKPDPEPVLKTLEELGYNACEALVIGDMPMDVAMGKNAGTYTCGVTYGNASRQQLEDAGAGYIIDSMRELIEVIDRI